MNEKRCSRCGFIMPIQAKFCPKCGLAMEKNNSYQSLKKKNSIIIAFGIGIVIVCILVMIVNFGASSSDLDSSSPEAIIETKNGNEKVFLNTNDNALTQSIIRLNQYIIEDDLIWSLENFAIEDNEIFTKVTYDIVENIAGGNQVYTGYEIVYLYMKNLGKVSQVGINPEFSGTLYDYDYENGLKLFSYIAASLNPNYSVEEHETELDNMFKNEVTGYLGDWMYNAWIDYGTSSYVLAFGNLE